MIAAAAALFAIAAPRQRTLALRWVEREYRVRLRSTAAAISDTTRALRPGSNAAMSPPAAIDRVTAQIEPPIRVPPRATGEQAAADPVGAQASATTAASAAAGSAEDSSEGAAGAQRPNEDLARDTQAPGDATLEPHDSSQVSAAPASSATESRASNSKQAARDVRSAGTTTKARAHVAAPRKRAQGDDNRRTASATKVPATSGSSATKARATRQNTPRKDNGSGIIRETPF
jgi:hypothetical protein